MKITVVYDKKTWKVYPFVYGDKGEVLITASGTVNTDNLIVSMLDCKIVDLETMYLTENPNGEKNT